MRTFFAVEFYSGRRTTTGKQNKRTRRYDIACTIAAFATASERDAWVAQGKPTPAMQGNCREAVTFKELRRLKRGHSELEFKALLETLKAVKDDA